MRKHILIFGHDYTTHFIDIYNQYTRLFDKEKYHVTVAFLTGAPTEEIKQRSLAENIIFLDIPQKKVRSLKISAIRQLLNLTRKMQFHIVICHRYKPAYIMMWVSHFFPIPILISVMHELHTMSTLKRKLLIASIAPKNMIFAGVSNAVRDNMRNDLWWIPKKRIVTLYNMIDVELTEPQLFSKEEARKKLNLPEDVFIFGNLARLVKNKDHETLIHAFALIKKDCPKAKLVILGKGILETKLKQKVAACQLTHDIIFTGFLSHGFRYMKAFDCFVLPSVQEAFGRVLLEAMLASLPIIATRVHGIPEVMGNTGLLVEPKNAKALAAEMKKIYSLSLSEREEYSRRACEHAKNHFSIQQFHQQFWNNIE